MNIPYRQKQKGAVLIVSLMLLLVLTVLGVTGLSNTSLEERMASNFHHTTLAYQAAESALEKLFMASDPEISDNPFYVLADDPIVDASNEPIDDTSTIFSFTPDGHLTNASLNTSTTVSNKGEQNCPATTFGEILCLAIQAKASATIAATNTSVTHVLGLQRPMPGNQNSKNLIN